ncbi:ribonuclease H-like domain-containing protein [Tanacetum coccineum]|uniref:Ribonuclease H-like domain-containing protein n=1 Tax=Tanacetum coccineum TaxID=301880 RepID=A0ABQ5GEM0_9ASTR
MDLETAQTTTTVKLPILKQENGNSFKPVAQTTTNADGTSTSLIPGLVTTEEKAQKKNDVKVRSILLMVLPNEHLMTFNQYKDAKTLFAAIQTRFGSNEATKKTQKTLLKQMYENFSASKDLNLKFLRSLPSEWNTHVVVWKNKPDLDIMSFDDLYNNFKIVEQEVKGIASLSSSSSSQNMAFVSSPSSTNEVNTAYGVSMANTQVSPASTQVSTASTQVSTANLSDDTVYAFLASQPNGSQLVYEDLEQIHEDNIEEMDLNDTAGYDKSKVECFNCHKMGHFTREYRGPWNQDSRNRNQNSSRRTINVEETSSKAIVAIDGAVLNIKYFRHFLDILRNYDPIDDEPMWAADHVVAPNPGSAITISETANEFAIKGNHLTLVKGNQFDGRTKTDPHKHIHEFLGICDMFKYRDTENEAIRLMMFPLSLMEKQKHCWTNSTKELSKHRMNLQPLSLAVSFP